MTPSEAKDELIRELTFHADALRGALLDILMSVDDLPDLSADWQATIEAYDQFVREA